MNKHIGKKVLFEELMWFLFCVMLTLVLYANTPSFVVIIVTALVIYVLSTTIAIALNFFIWVISRKVSNNV
jgi:hypothetical protein